VALHPLLVRELHRQGVDPDAASAEWRAVLERVSQAYSAGERERERLDTIVDLVGDNLVFLQRSLDKLLIVYGEVRALVPSAYDDAIAALEDKADLAFLEAEGPRAIQQSLYGVGQLAQIVQAMRVCARQQRSHGPSYLDVNAALQRAVTVARGETKAVAEVILELHEVGPILAFPEDLEHVFSNLVVNAAHAVRESGRRGTIRIRTASEAERAVISVQDTGTGIPTNMRGRIFDPLFTTKEGRGLGRGLALAHAIVVDKHGGTIDYESVVGKGTTFYVRLPLKGAREAAA
jgi:signal transduction histidine kinase